VNGEERNLEFTLQKFTGASQGFHFRSSCR
jgi:hypothetical protein